MPDATLLKALSEDRALGSSVLFSRRHANISPEFHVKILDAWAAADEFVLIQAFRGGGKTTLAEEFLLMEACFGNFQYCLLISETYAKACETLETMAYEATHNERLERVYGKILARKAIENKLWFASGALVQAVGWEQEFRAFKYRNYRPDRAYLDDIENLERVRDSEAVDATIAKLYRQLMPAMDRERRKIRYTQTPLAPDCAVTRLAQAQDWAGLTFPIAEGDPLDPAANSLWPDKFPIEWVRSERARYERMGMLKDFNQEFMLEADSPEAHPFQESMLRYADLAPAAWLPRWAIYDPARTASAEKSDRTGHVVVSRLGSKIICHASGGDYWKPDELRADVFETEERHKCVGVAIEKNSLDDYLLQPLRYEMMRRGRAIQIEAVQAPQDRDKFAFIMGLQPFFKAGDVILVGGRQAHAQLVAEMLNFPSGSLDVLNALAYALKVFSGDIVYEDFGESNIAPAHDPGFGETVWIAWNADPSTVVAVALERSGRHYSVAGDWAVTGALNEACAVILEEVAVRFARASLEHWMPAELHESEYRVALLSALRAKKATPFRAAYASQSRGALSDLIRMQVRDRRRLTCDARARGMVNALAGGYRFKVLAGGKRELEPERGISRLVGEALESLIAALEAGAAQGEFKGAHYAVSPGGVKHMTALPQARRGR